jgi:hypothetical protein
MEDVQRGDKLRSGARSGELIACLLLFASSTPEYTVQVKS